MKDDITRFFDDLDATLVPFAEGERLELYHIGRSSLVWKYGLTAATKDVDVIGVESEGRLIAEAIRLFGAGTPKAEEHDLYLELVPAPLPPVPPRYKERAEEAIRSWSVIRLWHLEAHDMVVTKLRRFSQRDRQDVRSVCDLVALDPALLEQRLASVMWSRKDWYEEDGGPEYANTFANLRVVQKYLNEGVWG